MKYIIFVADGMADLPVEKLGGRTPLEHMILPNMDKMASMGKMGSAETVPISVAPGTDTAFYSIMGYDVETCFTGRAPLEAAGMGIALQEGEIAFRCNLVSLSQDPFDMSAMLSHSAGNIDHEDGRRTMERLVSQPKFQQALAEFGMRIEIGRGFRHIAVIGQAEAYNIKEDFTVPPPHDIVGKRIRDYMDPQTNTARKIWRLMRLSNELLSEYPPNIEKYQAGQMAGNCIWLWGAGTKPAFQDMRERFGVVGSVISAVPLVNGIGRLCGLTPIAVEGATGDKNTNYRGKAEMTVRSLMEKGYDFVLLHVEAPDECSHDGDLKGKMFAIENIDKMLAVLEEGLQGVDHRILFLSDHITSVDTRTHDWGSVPYFLYDSTDPINREVVFDETTAARFTNKKVKGMDLIEKLLRK